MAKRHIFILNPAAGQGDAVSADLRGNIFKAARKLNIEVEIYETKEFLDGEVFADKIAEEATEENPIRLYACGGDGTLNETLNGIIGHDFVELAVLPVGTGNDFIRNFGSAEEFLDIEGQLLGEVQKTDIIKYRWKKNDYEYERYCINMFNIGFDCNVVDKTAKLKKMPLVSGSMAYGMGVANMLIQMKGANLKVVYEDGHIYDGPLLLIAIANGCYCGGGIKGLPLAITNDGLLDIGLVKQTTRRNFLKLYPKYKEGTHLGIPLAKKIVDYRQGTKLKIFANDEDVMFSTDGEISYAEEIEFEIIPKGIDFVIPKKCNR